MFQARAVWDGYFSTVNGLFSTIEKSTASHVLEWGKFSTLEKSAAHDVIEWNIAGKCSKLGCSTIIRSIPKHLGQWGLDIIEKLLRSSPSPTNKVPVTSMRSTPLHLGKWGPDMIETLLRSSQSPTNKGLVTTIRSTPLALGPMGARYIRKVTAKQPITY